MNINLKTFAAHCRAVKPLRKGSLRGVFLCCLILHFGGGAASVQAQAPESAPEKMSEQSVSGDDLASGIRAYDEGRYEDARAIWEKLAFKDDHWAQYRLGHLYEVGGGKVARNYTLALLWYSRATEGKVREAQNNFALMLASGRGINTEPRRAVALWQEASEAGYSVAQLNLATAYLLGHGVKKDGVQGIGWLQASAAGGLSESQFRLAKLYHQGAPYLAQNLSLALAWYTRAAEQGYEQALPMVRRLEAADVTADHEVVAQAVLKTRPAVAVAQAGVGGPSLVPIPNETPAPASTRIFEAQTPLSVSARPSRVAETVAAKDTQKGQLSPATLARNSLSLSDALGFAEEKIAPEKLHQVRARPADKLASDSTPKETATKIPPRAAGESPPTTADQEALEVAALVPQASGQASGQASSQAARQETEPAGDHAAAVPYSLWLASVYDIDAGRALWSLFQARFSGALSGVSARLNRHHMADGDVLFRLQVGSFSDRAQAQAHCDLLRWDEPQIFCKILPL